MIYFTLEKDSPVASIIHLNYYAKSHKYYMLLNLIEPINWMELQYFG